MRRKLYAIRDTLAEALGPIVVMAADAAAIRMFGDVASDPQTNVSRHIADHVLLCLGSVDDGGHIDGEYADPMGAFAVTPGSGPRVVITGSQWKASQAPSEPQLALEA